MGVVLAFVVVPIVLIVGAVVGIGMCAGAADVIEEQEAQSTASDAADGSSPAARQSAAASDSIVTIQQFTGAFSANEIAANERFRGKTILLRATVDRVSEGGIWLEPGEFSMNDIVCRIPTSQRSLAAALMPGESVVLSATFVGIDFLTYQFSQCEIVQSGAAQ